jgi:hypothetical protein
VTKLSTTGAMVYSTYLGGNSSDSANGIAVDFSGNAHVTGFTASSRISRRSILLQASHGGGSVDVFITKLNALGLMRVYSTLLGGEASESGRGIAVDSAGNAYVAGSTSSVGFPLVRRVADYEESAV